MERKLAGADRHEHDGGWHESRGAALGRHRAQRSVDPIDLGRVGEAANAELGRRGLALGESDALAWPATSATSSADPVEGRGRPCSSQRCPGDGCHAVRHSVLL